MVTARNRIAEALRGEPVDKVPFTHWHRHFPRGETEREVRNRGMALCLRLPCFLENRPNVQIVQSSVCTSGAKLIKYTYHTPLGEAYELRKAGIGYGDGVWGRDYKGLTPWRISPEKGRRLIKSPKDYDIVKFIVEDTRYTPYYEAIEDYKHYLGDDGLVITSLPYTPWQMMLINWVGPAQLYRDYVRHRDKVEELYAATAEKYREMYPLVVDAPVDYVNYGDNIDGVMVSPPIFEKYHVPIYNELANQLEGSEKILGSHMDGRLKILAQAIAKTKLDVIEAFTPPPMGDLPVGLALSLWKDKTLWINYPMSVYLSGGPEGVKRQLLNLLKEAIPGDRIVLAASTELFVPLESLRAITEIMAKATCPLSEEQIEEIEESISLC